MYKITVVLIHLSSGWYIERDFVLYRVENERMIYPCGVRWDPNAYGLRQECLISVLLYHALMGMEGAIRYCEREYPDVFPGHQPDASKWKTLHQASLA